jgi:hypothetical protein
VCVCACARVVAGVAAEGSVVVVMAMMIIMMIVVVVVAVVVAVMVVVVVMVKVVVAVEVCMYLVEAAVEVHHNLACSVVIHNLKLANVACTMHKDHAEEIHEISKHMWVSRRASRG